MVKKQMARDCELSTTGTDAGGEPLDSWLVTRKVLREVETVFRNRGSSIWTGDTVSGQFSNPSAGSMDCLRHWLPNGQCIYSDMGHVEVCTAETSRPRRFAAQCISTLLIAEKARRLAQRASECGEQFSLSAANADTLDPSVSWGTHLNVAISSGLWNDLFVTHRRPAMLGYVASVMAAAVPFFGSGYLLPLKGGGAVYSLSARAHHLTQVHTLATTQEFHRGLLNTRREPHCKNCDRLHLIGFDFSLVSAALLCSFVQCALAAAEEGFCGLILYNPVNALRAWSWRVDPAKPGLRGVASMIDHRRFTLPEYMRVLSVHPELATRGRVITHDRFVLATLFDRDNAIAGDCKTAVATADRLPPDETGWLCLPVAPQSGADHNTVTPMTAVLGHVGILDVQQRSDSL